MEPGDIVLVRKMTHTGKHKIQNRWEDDEYVDVSQPNSDIPMYIVQTISGGKQKTLSRNLLLPLVYKDDGNVENVGSDEEIEMVSQLFEFKGNSERVNKPTKVDQVNTSTKQVSNTLIHLHDSLVVLISKYSSNDPEQNVQKSLIESFDSEDEIVVSPTSVQNKSPKMEMSNLPESLHITEMIKQAPSVREYSTKGELTPLIEQDLTQSGNSTLNTQFVAQGPQREGESSSNCIFKSDASVPQEVFYGVHSNSGRNLVQVIQSTQSDSDSEIGSEPQEPVAPRRFKRSTKGATPTRYGHVVAHKSVCPTRSWL